MKVELRLDSQMPFLDLKWVDEVDGEPQTATVIIDFGIYQCLGFVDRTSVARTQALTLLRLDELPDSFGKWPCGILLLRKQNTETAVIYTKCEQLRKVEFVQELAASRSVAVCIHRFVTPQVEYLMELLSYQGMLILRPAASKLRCRPFGDPGRVPLVSSQETWANTDSRPASLA